MKALLIFLAIVLVSILWPTDLSLGSCPEAPYDNGLCDTMRVEAYPPDTAFLNPGQLVRVPVYVTHDVPDSTIDSIASLVIPFCYTHTNPTKYCSLTAYWNQILWSSDRLSRSIFRHLPSNDDPQIHNWMMDLFNAGNNEEWNGVILDLDGISHFQIALIPSGSEDPKFGPENHRLLFTMTFKVKDTTTVCIDTCFWPPSDRLCFSRSDAVTYIPRHNLPYCFSVSCPVRGNPTGGLNGDCTIDVGDIIFLIGYLYKNAPPPDPLERGDANCDGVVDIGDVIDLINYLFKGGPAPFC
jgi:hypothetical protein